MKLKSVLVMLDPLSLPRLDGICSYAKEHGWAVILEDRLPEDVDFARIDGAIVCLRGRRDHLVRIRTLRRLGKPVVDLTVACPRERLPRVISDNRALGALAARHFLEHGFENFAWYSSSWSHVHALRHGGFASAVKGRSVMRIEDLRASLPALRLPLAVLAFDETDAARLISECRACGLEVPGDVAVMGIGNDPFLCENGDITISSVDQNLAGAAREACALLEELMAAGPSADPKLRGRTILVPPLAVIPRASTETLAHPDPTIRAVLVYIHRHLNRSFGSAEVAEALKMARSTLDHLFNERVGHSIGREILDQRLLRAKRLLRDESVPLRAIARVCGFCNASYFTNIFKRETGLLPKIWRRSFALPPQGARDERTSPPIPVPQASLTKRRPDLRPRSARSHEQTATSTPRMRK